MQKDGQNMTTRTASTTCGLKKKKNTAKQFPFKNNDTAKMDAYFGTSQF